MPEPTPEGGFRSRVATVSHRLFTPKKQTIPVVVEVPHAGLGLDHETMNGLIAPVRCLLADADLFVDRLVDNAPQLGASLLVATMSRHVCDLNREPSQIDGRSVEGAQGENAPFGFVWRATSDGEPSLLAPLRRSEHERRRTQYWEPYHRALGELLFDLRSRFGHAILLSVHSMPSTGKAGSIDAHQVRADIVPGTRGGTTAHPALLRTVETVTERFGWSLRHDYPYQGAYTTSHYGLPRSGLHAVQLEISRARYMDEETLLLTDRWITARDYCLALILELGRFEQRELFEQNDRAR